MRNAAKTMYKIGRIFSFVLLGLTALLVVIYSILMIVEAVNGNFPLHLGSVIGYLIWLGLVIAMIILASNAIKSIAHDEKAVAPHVTMIVAGAISGDIFYLLGGIFSLVANGQEGDKPAEKKEEEKK